MLDFKESLEIPVGTVIFSKAGRDKGCFLVCLKQLDEDYVLLVDGKKRPIERPKKKKLMHLQKTNTVLDIDEKSSNKRIRRLLREYVDSKEDF